MSLQKFIRIQTQIDALIYCSLYEMLALFQNLLLLCYQYVNPAMMECRPSHADHCKFLFRF